MDYVNAIIRGDIWLAADMSFDCIMCGLCTIRCPAEMAQYNVAILARRLYGRYLTKRSNQMFARIKEIEEGKFDRDMEEIMNMPTEQLKQKYKERSLDFDIT